MMKHENALKTISEVVEIIGVEAHVLRFWESNFPSIKLKKLNGRRYFSKENIEHILQIKEMLYKQKLSIKEANTLLKKTNSPLLKIKTKLLALKHRLEKVIAN